MSNVKILIEYQGFLRFVTRACRHLVSWFGPHCNYDPNRVMIMSAREWDAMSDDERRYFIKADFIKSRQKDKNPPKGVHSFLSFMLHRRYATASMEKKDDKQQLDTDLLPAFNPHFVSTFGQLFKELPQEERDKYSKKTLTDTSIDHVLEKRAILHKMYNPKELNFLEYIIKTSPRKPKNARCWYSLLMKVSFTEASTRKTWNEMEQINKNFYDSCFTIDSKRYKFEKKALLNNLLKLSYKDDDYEYTLEDFDTEQAKSNRECLKAIINLNKELPIGRTRFKRSPSSPFSLFIRDKNCTGSDRTNMKRMADQWLDLPEEERKVYDEKVKKLRSAYSRLLVNEFDDRFIDICSVSKPLFNNANLRTLKIFTKSSHFTSSKKKNSDIFLNVLKNIPKKHREEAWNAMPEEEKKLYIEEYNQKFEEDEKERNKMKEKVEYIEGLLEKAKKLEKLKRDLKLVRCERHNVRNLYPQLKHHK